MTAENNEESRTSLSFLKRHLITVLQITRSNYKAHSFQAFYRAPELEGERGVGKGKVVYNGL